MDALISIALGTICILVGYKIINPFRGSKVPEKELEWYSKYAVWAKIGGCIIVGVGILRLIYEK